MFDLTDMSVSMDIAVIVGCGLILFLLALISFGLEYVASLRDYGRDDGRPPG